MVKVGRGEIRQLADPTYRMNRPLTQTKSKTYNSQSAAKLKINLSL